MTYLFNLFRSLLCGTVSNDFERSIIFISTCNLLLNDWATSCVVIISCDTVEFLLRKSCCLSVKTKWQSIMMLVNIICSRILQHIDVTDMGR